MSITHLLVDTAMVQRLQEIPRGSGRFEKAYVTIASEIAFREFVASAKEQAMAMQLRMNLTHTGYCEPDQDVAKDDQLVLLTKSGNTVAPRYFRVIGIPNPSLPHHQKLQLEEISQAKVS
jgi:hypothetical protein